jgi:phosphatidylglycerophosphatase A
MAKNNKDAAQMTPSKLFLSFGGVGYAPYAPGTAGSLATLPFLYLLSTVNTPPLFVIPPLITILLISIFVINKNIDSNSGHDPSWIVIDEVVGMTTAWLFVTEHSLLSLVTIFLLFRLFDIIKVWPASYFDNKIETGVGVMLDDVISAIYAGLVYQLSLLLL